MPMTRMPAAPRARLPVRFCPRRGGRQPCRPADGHAGRGPAADDLGIQEALNLNANQQTLWLQIEGPSRAMLRERQHRREALQEKAKTLLGKPDVELRELGALVEAESAPPRAQEDKQLRELWLSLNDALDDGQRRQVATLVNEQLLRVVPEGRPGGDAAVAARRAENAAAAGWAAMAVAPPPWKTGSCASGGLNDADGQRRQVSW
jgi:hypothetical protein